MTQPESTTTQIESLSEEVRRIDFTGTVWFAAAVVSTAIVMSGLLASGWRPTDLAAADAFAWWAGSLLALAGMGMLAWAGCPVFAFTLQQADRQKTLSIRLGVALFLGGSVVAVLAVLLAPAG